MRPESNVEEIEKEVETYVMLNSGDTSLKYIFKELAKPYMFKRLCIVLWLFTIRAFGGNINYKDKYYEPDSHKSLFSGYEILAINSNRIFHLIGFDDLSETLTIIMFLFIVGGCESN